MKHFFTYFTGCIFLLYLTGCSTSRKVTRAPHPPHQEQKLAFMTDVAIVTNGGNAVQLQQRQQVYQSEKPVAPVKEASKADESEQSGTDLIDNVHNQALAAFIEEWYGVPYQYGGECKEGIDCSAFVRELYKDVYHIHLLRTARQQFATSGHVRKWEKLKEGDLVFFKIHSSHISHVGVYLGGGKFVHASFSSGVMISDLKSPYWTRYYVGGGRVKG